MNSSSGPALFTYSVNVAIAFGAGSRTIKKIWANGKILYNIDNPKNGTFIDHRYAEIKCYAGTLDQLPDPTIQTAEGVANVPAFRGTCYAVITGLQLADFSNVIPNFTAELEHKSGEITLTDAFNHIFEAASWDDTFFQITDLPEIEMKGMVISGPTMLAKVIEPLMVGFNLYARETEHILEFLSRDDSDVIELTEEMLGFSENQPHPKYEITDTSERDLPSEVNVRFIDERHSNDPGQKRQRHPSATTNNVVTIDLPIVMSGNEGRKLARTRLYSAYAESQSIMAALPPEFMRVQEGDVLQRTEIGNVRGKNIRVMELQRGWNQAVEIKGFFDQHPAHLATGVNDNEEPDELPDTVTPLAVHAIVMDIPPLRDEDVNIPGIYVAVGPKNGGDEFRASTLYYDFTNTGNYANSIPLTKRCIIGETLDALDDPPSYPADPVPAHVLTKDTVSTVSVEITSGSLSSASDSDVINGQNWCMIGGEMVGFTTATLTVPRTYTLSGLYRGIRDTAHAVTGHSTGDKFVLLNRNIVFLPIPIAHRLDTLAFKVVSLYGSLTSSIEFTMNWRAENVKCFRVYDPNVYRDDNDIHIQWTRQSRRLRRLLDWTSGPLEEPSEDYYLIIYEAGGTTPIRSVQLSGDGGTDEVEFNYTVAMQTADGHTPGADIKVRITQIGRWMSTGTGPNTADRPITADNL